MRPFTRKELPRTLQIVGSAMQQIGNPNNRALERFQANEADQMRQQAEDMALNRQTKMEDQQRSQLEEAIKTLPADQQVWARMNPSAFIRALVERQMDPNNGWQVGQGYSRAFRIRPDGTREDGAELPLRPRAPITGYVIPDDAQEWHYSDDAPR